MVEQEFREKVVGELGRLTEAVSTLKEGISALHEAVEKADLKGYKCRAEVDASITKVRLDLGKQVAGVRNRVAFIGGGLAVAGFFVGSVLRVFGG